MSRRIHRLSMTFATALISLVVASSALAQSGERGASFELFGARVQPVDTDADFHTESYGVRGGFRFTPVWALEGAISRLNEDGDVWFGDLSAKAYAIHSDRFGVYALAGPGLFKVSGEDEEVMVHLGIGAEINLGGRAYVRPEVRGRWLADELNADEGLVDYSVGFGWRF